MFLGAIYTKTKRQPVSPALPWIRTYQVTCTILVFNEGFMVFRADYVNDMMAVAWRHIHHGTAAAILLEKYGAEFKKPEDVFGVPNNLLTPQLIRSNPKYALLPLVPADEVFHAWIASDSLFSKKGPWAMAILGQSKEWRASMLSRVHLIQSDPSGAAALLRQVVPAKKLKIKLPGPAVPAQPAPPPRLSAPAPPPRLSAPAPPPRLPAPAPPPRQPADAQTSWISHLLQLAQLHDQGVLSDTAYAAAKQRILEQDK